MQRSQNLAFAVSFAVMILLLISVSFAISYAQHGIDPNWSAQLAVTKSAATVSADGAVANNIWASRTSAFFTQLTTLQASDHQFSRTFVMYIATIHRYTPLATGNRYRENILPHKPQQRCLRRRSRLQSSNIHATGKTTHVC